MNIAIILSGGIGSRMGTDKPKQYIEICGKPIIRYGLDTFLNIEDISIIIIVVADEWKEYLSEMTESFVCKKPIYFAKSGETRQYSIFNALIKAKEYGAKEDDVVIIHDAARPLVSKELILSCIEGCKSVDGVLPVIPVSDTLYQSLDGKHISSLLNRNELFAGQAPESFLFGKYYRIHNNVSREELLKIHGSTEIAYKNGMQIKLIKGEEANFKITTPEDLSTFESIIKYKIGK